MLQADIYQTLMRSYRLQGLVGQTSCFEHPLTISSLVSWFRTPGAYIHEIQEPLTPDLDTSYRSKVCHVCRATIVRRPARYYHLREPLGIHSTIPTASQENAEREDPWQNLFPPEKDCYRIHDSADGVTRCPECYGEIEDGLCTGCGIEFSASESDGGDWESDLGSEGSGLEDEGSDGSVESGMEGESLLSGSDAGLDSEEEAVLDRPRAARERRLRLMIPQDDQPRRRRHHERNPDVLPLLDLMAEDDLDGVAPGEDYPEEEDSADDDYGGSFIDDGELSGAGGETDDDSHGSRAGGSVTDGEMEVDHNTIDLAEVDEAEANLPIEELRRRRMEHHGALRRGWVVDSGHFTWSGRLLMYLYRSVWSTRGEGIVQR